MSAIERKIENELERSKLICKWNAKCEIRWSAELSAKMSELLSYEKRA